MTQILHVEDSSVDHAVVMKLFQGKGLEYAVDWAPTVTEAMQMLAENQYDLILLDYMLPDGTGLDLLGKAKGVPVVFFTGKGSEQVTISAMQQGAYDHVVKDSRGAYVDILPAVIERALKAVRREKEKGEIDIIMRDSEERYRILFEQYPYGIVFIDPETLMLLEFNEAAYTQLGYSREEFARLRLQDFEAAETTEQIKAHIGKILLMLSNDFETRHRTKGGDIRNVMVTAQIIELHGKSLINFIFHDITEQRTSEVRIKYQFERLLALRNIDMAITASLDLRVTLNVIIEEIFKTIHADAVDVLIMKPNTLRLEYAAGQGFRTKVFQHTNLRIGDGYGGKSALEGRSIYIPDIMKEPADMVRAPLLSEEAFVSYWCVPLISKGNIKGVIEMFYRNKNELDPEIIDFGEAIALQAAIAIDNASMFNNLQRSNIELSLAYDTTIEGWSKALDLRDKETEGHSQRVTEMTMRIARDMGMSEEELIHVRRGALLHDIGKMGVPDNILLKPGKLNDDEWVSMRKHPTFAYELLFPISYLHPALDIPYCHHEKWDGTGYPRGLKGEQIPLSARIFSIVDVWDALCSDRPYRPVWSKEKTLEHIKSLSGFDFDPKIVKMFLDVDW